MSSDLSRGEFFGSKNFCGDRAGLDRSGSAIVGAPPSLLIALAHPQTGLLPTAIMLLFGWLATAFMFQIVRGENLPANERCVTAVYSAYNYVSFAGIPAKGMWDTRCQNPLKVASIYAASEVYCRDQERATGLAQLALLCETFGHRELLPREAVAENLTEDAIRNMRTVGYLEVSRAEILGTPVLLSASYFSRMYNTIDTWQFETWSHHSFGYIGYAYWAIILACGAVHQLWSYAFHPRKFHEEPSLESQVYPQPSIRHALPWVEPTFRWVQTHLIVPAPFATQGRTLIGLTFSNRAESVVVAGFWLLSIILSLVGYRTFPGNIYWPGISDQILRYSADRTGIMSFANFPLLWLFGGRNNVLIWATGWSFARLNVFHRHVARVATLQGIAHSFLYFVIIVRANKLWKDLSKMYILWGILAFFVMILLLVTSLDRIRTMTYEVFLVTHILFSVICLIGCFYHTIIFEGHEYWKYLWPSVAVWAIDRALRIVRIFYCNLHVNLSGHTLIRGSESVMTYDEVADVIRLEVTPGTRLRFTPGDYYFLYQPFRLTGWENHPFTVGATSYEVESERMPCQTSLRKPDESLDTSQLPLLSETQDNSFDMADQITREQDAAKLKLIFWIRPYDGWTQQLRQQCLQSKSPSVNAKILLEGPYGHNFPLWNYESVLMIVGGTGIASAVPYLQDHIRRSSKDRRPNEGTRIRDIELVWTARQSALLRDISTRELAPILAREDFQASFYTTGSSREPTQDLGELGCTIQSGRPHLQSLIMSRACDASASNVSLVILVCGPAGMADEARAATHLAMRQGYRSIKYVEESFAW